MNKVPLPPPIKKGNKKTPPPMFNPKTIPKPQSIISAQSDEANNQEYIPAEKIESNIQGSTHPEVVQLDVAIERTKFVDEEKIEQEIGEEIATKKQGTNYGEQQLSASSNVAKDIQIPIVKKIPIPPVKNTLKKTAGPPPPPIGIKKSASPPKDVPTKQFNSKKESTSPQIVSESKKEESVQDSIKSDEPDCINIPQSSNPSIEQSAKQLNSNQSITSISKSIPPPAPGGRSNKKIGKTVPPPTLPKPIKMKNQENTVEIAQIKQETIHNENQVVVEAVTPVKIVLLQPPIQNLFKPSPNNPVNYHLIKQTAESQIVIDSKPMTNRNKPLSQIVELSAKEKKYESKEAEPKSKLQLKLQQLRRVRQQMEDQEGQDHQEEQDEQNEQDEQAHQSQEEEPIEQVSEPTNSQNQQIKQQKKDISNIQLQNRLPKQEVQNVQQKNTPTTLPFPHVNPSQMIPNPITNKPTSPVQQAPSIKQHKPVPNIKQEQVVRQVQATVSIAANKRPSQGSQIKQLLQKYHSLKNFYLNNLRQLDQLIHFQKQKEEQQADKINHLLSELAYKNQQIKTMCGVKSSASRIDDSQEQVEELAI